MTKLKGIRERSGSFMADVTIEGKRKTKTFKNIADAIAYREKYEATVRAGGDLAKVDREVARGTMTLSEAYDLTYEDYWKESKGEKSALINANQALNFFGGKCKVSAITDARLKEYKKDILASGNSPTTCDRKLSSLSKILATAVEAGKLDKKPVFKNLLSKLSKDKKVRTAFLTEEKEREFLDKVLVHVKHETNGKWSMFHDFVCFLIDTGARTYGEGMSLMNRLNPEVSCIQWHNNTILFPVTKTGEPRAVPMTTRVKQILAKRVKTARNDKIWYLLTKDNVRHYWDTIRAEMGWQDDKNYCPYICRHTTATRMVTRGVALPIVMTFMGHANWETTLGYSHFAPSSLNVCAEALEKDQAETNVIDLTATKAKRVAG